MDLTFESVEKSLIKCNCFNTVGALVSGHPRDAKKVSVTGAGRLGEQTFRPCVTAKIGTVLKYAKTILVEPFLND